MASKKHKASRKPARRTVADKPRKQKEGSLESRLTRAFSLTDCKRLVALAEKWSEDTQKHAAAGVRIKTLKERRADALNEGNKRLCEQTAESILETEDEKKVAKDSIKATVNDLIRILLDELADGSTVWAAAQSAAEEEAQEPDDPAQMKLGGEGGDPTKNPLDS